MTFVPVASFVISPGLEEITLGAPESELQRVAEGGSRLVIFALRYFRLRCVHLYQDLLW